MINSEIGVIDWTYYKAQSRWIDTYYTFDSLLSAFQKTFGFNFISNGILSYSKLNNNVYESEINRVIWGIQAKWDELFLIIVKCRHVVENRDTSNDLVDGKKDVNERIGCTYLYRTSPTVAYSSLILYVVT